MDKELDRLTLIVAVCVASYVAIMLDHVALCGFGLSRREICGGAGTLAILIGALIAMDYLGNKLRQTR